MYIECTAACNISCTRGLLRAGNRHYPHPPGGHARLRSLPPGDRRSRRRRSSGSTSSTTAKRSCTSAPSRCASTSRPTFPHIYLYTSTNGLALTEAQARRLVHSGIDEVTFSIDGATPESYAKYRQRGRFDVAIANLRAMADEKRRSGRDLPFLNWRYILFKWNDSDEEMNARARAGRRDRRRSPVLGDDGPSRNAYSRRFVPGSPDARRDSPRNLGRQQPGQRHSRRDAARANRRAHARARRAAHRARRPAACRSARASTTSRRGRSRRRRRTAGASSGSARSCARRTGRCSTATSRARGCPQTLGPGDLADVADRDPGAGAAGALHVEVRSGQRRDRLVRALRVADDDPKPVGPL